MPVGGKITAGSLPKQQTDARQRCQLDELRSQIIIAVQLQHGHRRDVRTTCATCATEVHAGLDGGAQREVCAAPKDSGPNMCCGFGSVQPNVGLQKPGVTN